MHRAGRANVRSCIIRSTAAFPRRSWSLGVDKSARLWDYTYMETATYHTEDYEDPPRPGTQVEALGLEGPPLFEAERHITTHQLEDGLVFEIHGAELFAVPSDSKPRIYQVILSPGARPHCTCPARTPHCKHVRRVLAARAGF